MRMITSAMAVAALVLAGCSSAPSSSAAPGAAPSTSTSAAPHRPASAAALAARLKAAGLPVSGLIIYTAVTDPNHELGRQGGYTGKVAWVDRRAEKAGAGKPATADERGDVSYGGGIEVFPTAAQARARAQYIQGFGQMLADGYDYTDGGALLRLSKYLTPAQARGCAASPWPAARRRTPRTSATRCPAGLCRSPGPAACLHRCAAR